jgi:hypothetical protein
MKRTRLGGLAAAVLALALLPGAPAVAVSADSVWHGYRIDAGDNASGSWIGGRVFASRPVYRLDPRAKPSTTGFGTAYAVNDFDGSGPVDVTPGLTSRAAWILSKYGTYPDATQAAAVDVAIYHLLHGGAYALSGTRTAERLSDSGHGAEIKSLATTMLQSSKTYAGPYRVSVSATGTVIGGQVPVAVKVVSTRTGAEIQKLPVSVSFGSAAPVGLVTDTNGRAETAFATTVAGELPLAVTVQKLPETRLLVRRPTTAGASRIATAGIKTSRTVSTSVPVQAIPKVAAASSASPINVGQYATGTFTVSGGVGGTSRAAVISLHGPFADWASASCSPESVVSTQNRTVTNGSYHLPSYKVSHYGLYVWRVAVAGDRLNTAAVTCGAGTRVRTIPSASAKARYSSYAVGSRVRAEVTVGRLPAGYTGTATVKLYGPFSSLSAVGCPSTKLAREVSLPLTGNGTSLAPQVTLNRAGYYTWRVRVPASYFSAARVSACEAPGSTFRMVP